MNMNRKEFLKTAGTGLAFAGVLGWVSGCAGIRRIDVEKIGGGAAAEWKDEEFEILRLASLAPSGHNAQPWTVKRVEADRWIIGIEPSRRLPAVDPENREALLSLGAFLENLVLAVGARGKRANYRVIAKSGRDTEVVEVRLKQGRAEEFPMEKIIRRRTVRSGMQKREIAGADITFITGANSRDFLYFPPSSPQAKYLAEGTVEANRVQAGRNDAQEELADWIRWSNADARRYRNGLTPESMEITGISGWVVRSFFNRESVLSEGFRKKGTGMAAEQAANCGGWIVIQSGDGSADTLIETGRLFQRMSLRVRERKIALHPMTQMLEEKPWKNDVDKTLGLSAGAQFILRAGYVRNYPEPVSLRMPVSWFAR